MVKTMTDEEKSASAQSMAVRSGKWDMCSLCGEKYSILKSVDDKGMCSSCNRYIDERIKKE